MWAFPAAAGLLVLLPSCAPQKGHARGVVSEPVSRPGSQTAAPDIIASLEIEVAPVKQRHTNWCWAACTEMILSYHEAPVPQCKVVEDLLKSEGYESANPCLTSADVHSINVTGWPDLSAYGFKWSTTAKGKGITHKSGSLDKALGEYAIVKELNDRRPMIWAYSLETSRGKASSGHMIVVYGYLKFADGAVWIVCADPWDARHQVKYPIKEYARMHWRTFYGISKTS